MSRRGNMPPFVLGDGKRFCTCCQTQRPEQGGRWKVAKNGLTRRWSCAICEQHKREVAENRLTGG